MCGLWVVLFLIVSMALALRRATLPIFTVSYLVLLLAYSSVAYSHHHVCLITLWVLFLGLGALFNCRGLRRSLITKRLLPIAKRALPVISDTERTALTAGTVAWEGSIFTGDPNWSALLDIKLPNFSTEEQAFLDGPVRTLCGMIDDWDITHVRYDLPAAMWQFIKDNGFFGLIIPKAYGGKEFSAYAHSEILTRIGARSSTVSSTVSVPNSLGPAELLLHYGTEQQKNYYLPRLARGEEIPCFALTAPTAGSDAGAIPDYGIVCRDQYQGETVLGIRLTWSKRYITLAPVATVLGLAFKLYDPDHLLGQTESLGITCALIPTNHPGVQIGRRHFPLNCAFQNGPTQGQDVFIPMDWIIGGQAMAGAGWRMLMECLAAGRAISLPATAAGGAKVAAFASGAYARIRRQFNQPIGYFEGVQTELAHIVGNNYLIEAMRELTTRFIDHGEKPAVLSAVIKYHATELSRESTTKAMDIHGGKGICLGPNNYLGRIYQTLPIAITVEGANILTRSMIIFGQGVIRCHPYVYDEVLALEQTDPAQKLKAFDKALFGHIGFLFTNVFRTLALSLTGGCLARVPQVQQARTYKMLARYSAAFALLADMALLLLGGKLKRKEALSARLGDVFSYIYMLSAALKRHHQQGEPPADRVLLTWLHAHIGYKIQETLHEVLLNFSHPWVARLLRVLIFPLGRCAKRPSDELNAQVAMLVLQPTDTRDRLMTGLLLATPQNNLFDQLEATLQQVIATEEIERLLVDLDKRGQLKSRDPLAKIKEAEQQSVITADQAQQLTAAYHAKMAIINVDDFATEELTRS